MRLREIGNSRLFQWIEEGANIESAYLESVAARNEYHHIEVEG